MSKFFKSAKEEVKEEVVDTVDVVEEVEVEEEVKEVPKEELPNISFSVCKHAGKWYVVKIKFDVETGKVGKPELIGTGHLERFVAIEEFKINVARSKIV